ncbi:MAG TPA: mechanosensitive ion channel family protein [Caulobacteraceae bacterium]
MSIAAMIVAIALAWGVHRLAYGALSRLARRHGLLPQALLARTRGPTRLALMILALGAAAAVSPLPDSYRPWLRHLLQIGFIALLGWIALGVLHALTVVYSRRFESGQADSVDARRHLTQVRILERTAVAFILLLTMAAALMTFPAVRQYGISLLASAGAAGIIAGLALQPLLTNLIAGIQIALTQPIRLDDSVVVMNGEWGNVEEIGATYVVVRTWDLRRLVLPLSYFIQQPFQNWTRQDPSLIGTVMFYVDYTAPIDAMREQLTAIAKASPRWDGKTVGLQVSDLSERAMQVRALVSAKDAGATWDLRCEVREKMIAFLREHHPASLPRDRLAAADPGGLRGDGPGGLPTGAARH